MIHKETSLAKDWIKTIQLANQRGLALAFGREKEYNRLDKQVKKNLRMVIEKGAR